MIKFDETLFDQFVLSILNQKNIFTLKTYQFTRQANKGSELNICTIVNVNLKPRYWWPLLKFREEINNFAG